MVVDNAQTAMDCLGDDDPVGTCRASWITPPTSNRFDSICSERSLLGLLSQFDRIDLPSIALALIYKRLLGDSVFDRSYETSSRFIKKIDLNRFDLQTFLRIRALRTRLNEDD